MKRYLIFSLLVLLPFLSGMTEELSFAPDSLSISTECPTVSYPGCREVVVGNGLKLAAREVLIRLDDSEPAALGWLSDSAFAGSVGRELVTPIPTSAESRYDHLAERTVQAGQSVVEVLGEDSIDGRRYTRVLLFPVTVDRHGDLWRHERIVLTIEGRSVADDRVSTIDDLETDADRNAVAGSLSNEISYVIITSEQMLPALERLAAYRVRTGYEVQMKTVESITASYPGLDPAEQIRNYLTEFHANGGTYVLLAGDETIVPNRLVYQYNVGGTPDPDLLQPSDLYFADLDGNWDVDGDGVYGERSQDAPNFAAELLVGRLPLNDSVQFEQYTDNLITNESDPGHGDVAYLTNSLFYSSDQLRDYIGGGQHTILAEEFPSSFNIDTSLTVEQASGDAIAPSNLPGSQLDDVLTESYGIVNILAHGRSDGFVVRSSGYNEWPKSYMLIAEESGGHGCLDSLLTPGKPSLYISLACDNGGYDLGPAGAANRSVVQVLLSRDGGAVGFVGNTRWGWVGSSYLLHRTILQSLFENPEQPTVAALQAARDAYPYYPDLIYGLNYFGDPALRTYVSTPQKIDILIEGESVQRELHATSNSQPLAGARIVIVDRDGNQVINATTGDDGVVSLGWLPDNQLFTASISKVSHITRLFDLGPSIVTDVDEDTDLVPDHFTLAQNYPNPFNPTTVINYTLPKAQQVRLTVYNVLGQEVATLIDKLQTAGNYEIDWDATDHRGNQCASGVFFYRLETEEYSAVRKMLLVR